MSDSVLEIFNTLEKKFHPEKVNETLLYYFSLGDQADQKWTLKVTPQGCSFVMGKTSEQADCVLKCSIEFFRKLVLDGYNPGMTDILGGRIKTSNPSLLKQLKIFFS